MDASGENLWVDIRFDCLPLRSVGRMDAPLDASPKFRQLCGNIKAAIERHGSHNTYYLYNATCVFHLTNNAKVGKLDFRFEGCVFTDADDTKTIRTDLAIRLKEETCDWLNEPVIQWFLQTVGEAVRCEFDRYIAAGDLEQARQRLAKIQSESDDAGGFLGMYL
jgi:hypothetical protein